ncbi:MAG: response regulator [Gemmatimonadaceae bacterium]
MSGIVHQSGGSIWVDSVLGKGTTFKVYLPQMSESLAPPDSEPIVARVAGGRETVLVAEDEAAVRAIVGRVLEDNGYIVLLAEDGAAALAMARAHPGTIDLLLTDLVMPGMTGRQLATAVQAEWPEVDLIFMSGYTDDAGVRQGVLSEGMRYLQKPFQAATLTQAVRDVLDAAQRRRSKPSKGG